MMKNKYKFEYWLVKWLNYKQNYVKESTYMKYKNSIYIHIIPELGEMNINYIDNYAIQNYINKKLSIGESSLSPKSVKEIVGIIKSTLSYAEQNGVVNNCKFEQLILKNTYKPIRVLSKNEEKLLLNVLTNNIDIFKLGVLISLLTGVRIGELCALKWCDIDVAESIISVSRTMQRIQVEGKSTKTEIIVTTPKTNSSIRQIPIPKFLMNYMKMFIKREEQYVLSNAEGHCIEPRVMQYRFKKYINYAGVSEANFHALRHTFATRCIEAGVEIKVLSEILGHSSVNITLDRYVHNSIDFKKDNINRLNEYILSFSQS